VPAPIDPTAAVPLFLWNCSVIDRCRIRIIIALPAAPSFRAPLFSRTPIDTTPPLDNKGAFLVHSATLMCADQQVNT
jgi:hypothetical protein